MKSPVEKATEKFQQKYGCASSVLYGFCQKWGLEEDLALRLSCGFGGGIARTQDICGAVSGGIMVLGLKYGRGANDDMQVTDEMYRKTREFIARFRERQGSHLCRELIGDCELATEEGQRFFKENNLHEKICSPCVQCAVHLVEEMMG